MRVGIYGGTFSPVHQGHVSAAKAFMEQMWLDILYVIPTGQTPHKVMQGNATSEDRLAMCRLAFADTDGVIVSDMEMRRAGKSYTVDTLKQLSRPDDRLFLLMGTDMLLSLDTWRSADEIFNLCYPAYIRREDDEATTQKVIEKIAEYHQKYGKVVRRIVTPPIELSSSMVRDAVANGLPIHDMVDARVADYIRIHGLYT